MKKTENKLSLKEINNLYQLIAYCIDRGIYLISYKLKEIFFIIIILSLIIIILMTKMQFGGGIGKVKFKVDKTTELPGR